MEFPSRVVVTELEVDLNKVSLKTKANILGLAEELLSFVEKQKKKRLIVGLAGPSGAGKSFTAEVLRQISAEAFPNIHIETLTIDAFHFSNSALEQKGLTKVKGRFDTYDVESLVRKLTLFTEGEEVAFPTYSRKTHEPVEHTFLFKKGEQGVLYLEGLWVLYDRGGWEKLKPMLARAYYLDGDSLLMRARTIARHMRGGRKQEDAERFFTDSDACNGEIVEQTKRFADSVISLDE